jgi:hypothetical protein
MSSARSFELSDAHLPDPKETPMLRTLAAALLAATALAIPATASADVPIHSAISMRLVDSRHATLEFASPVLPRKADGTIDARYVLAPGKRASAIKKVGMHGTDTRYRSTVTSTSALRANVRYTVRLKIAGQKDIVTKIKLIDNRG